MEEGIVEGALPLVGVEPRDAAIYLVPGNGFVNGVSGPGIVSGLRGRHRRPGRFRGGPGGRFRNRFRGGGGAGGTGVGYGITIRLSSNAIGGNLTKFNSRSRNRGTNWLGTRRGIGHRSWRHRPFEGRRRRNRRPSRKARTRPRRPWAPQSSAEAVPRSLPRQRSRTAEPRPDTQQL